MQQKTLTPSNMADIQASLAELKAQPSSDFVEIFAWLSKNLNAAYAIISGTTQAKQLVKSGSMQTKFINRNGAYLAEMHMTWDSSVLGNKPDFELLNDLFEGITFKNVEYPEESRFVKADIYIDMREFKTVSVSMLWSTLYVALLDAAADSIRIEECSAKAKALLTYVFPEVSLDFVYLSANLGVFTDKQAFMAWLNTASNKSPVTCTTLPSGVVY